MPVIPYLEPMANKKLKTQMQDRFLGLCMRETANSAQFTDMDGLSSDEYPYLSQEKAHKTVRVLTRGRGLLGGECLSWVADGKLWYDGQYICDIQSDRPQLVRMGAYLVVWPDRIIYNTHTGELIEMDASWTNVTEDGNVPVTARPCMLSGQEYTYTASDTEPANPQQNAYWYNTQTGGFYQYLGTEWQGIDTVYSRLEGPDLGKDFKDYDVVKISGFSYEEYNMDAATVYGRGDDYIVIATGTINNFEETGEVTITRQAPEMDFICENGNRLWGCSSAKHEVYGSKLGDPTNWQSYLGISTDSYAATVGSEGHFTGLCAYMGYVLFWKEDRCHRLYGTRPENYQLVELPIRGVKTGCERSLCVVNGILYYVAREGVMAFDGASPVDIGDALGGAVLDQAVCGAHGDKLYLSADMLRRGADEREAVTLVMDTRRGLWHLLKDVYANAYASTPEGDFYLDDVPEGAGMNALVLIGGGTSKYEVAKDVFTPELTWHAVTGDYGMDSPNHKWVHRLTLRMKAERGSKLVIYIMYDDSGKWQRIHTYESTGRELGCQGADEFLAPRKDSTTIQLRTKRCDHFKLAYEGVGKILITSITLTRDEGSERG